LAISDQGLAPPGLSRSGQPAIAPPFTRHPWEITMQQDLVHAIKSNPKYHELVSKRKKFAWILAILMLVIYYGFILIIAFNKEFLSQQLWEGSITTVGIPIGLGVIISAFILTGIYVFRANSEFDRLTAEIKEEVL
jgi:uncharacterized membrane protein (DUF485 family)